MVDPRRGGLPLLLRCWLLAALLVAGGMSWRWTARASAPAPGAAAVTLSKSVQPAQANAGARVTYTISAINAGAEAARDLRLTDTLPAGFRYVKGTSRVYLNGALISASDPASSGQSLTWGPLTLPGARQGSYYGMHTFLQDRCQSDQITHQLDRTRELMGPGAYVKQLFYWITPQTSGPQSCWVDFVNAAYDRDLIPVVRLQGVHGGPYWLKPEPDAPGDYTTIAQAYRRVVQGLPRRDDRPLYVEIWNEPNLNIEWSGAANPVEYGHFMVDVAAAIRSIGDPRIRILNGALSPGGNYYYLSYLDAMATVPGALQSFDVWASHPYPGNHPPEYNIHDGSASYKDATIDSYLLELERLAAHGRSGVQVLLTETGYALGQNTFVFEGYPEMNEGNRADYISRAFRDYWRYWPEILGVCPYELVDPSGDWWVWDWIYPNGEHHWQYDSVRDLAKDTPVVPSQLRIVFAAQAAGVGGTYYNQVSATASNAAIPGLLEAAPVRVAPPTPTRTPTRTPTAIGTPPTPTPTLPCVEQVENGGFELAAGWQLSRAAYSVEQAQEGGQGLRLGIVDGANAAIYSSAWQSLWIPAEAERASLGFWIYPRSDDLADDLQIARLYDANWGALRSLVREITDAQAWQYREFDLLPYRGQEVRLYFGVINDGQGGTTSMYVDGVSLRTCGLGQTSPTPTATRSSTPTPTETATLTPSPTPTGVMTATPSMTPTVTPTPICVELASNRGFEETADWVFPDDAYPARYSTALAHGEARSLLLGIVDEPNQMSYSQSWQWVPLPIQAQQITLSFWYYPLSADAQGDRQYAQVLDTGGGPLESVMWVGADDRQWLRREYALDGYRGQAVRLHFGVYNDGEGGVTAMYVDDVSVRACWGLGLATPTPEPTLTATPTATPQRRYLPLILRDYLNMVAAAGEASPERAWTSGARAVVDARAGRVYVAAQGELATLDLQDGAVIAVSASEAHVHGLAVDPATGLLYLSDRARGRVAIWDGERVVGEIVGLDAPAGLALVDGRLYIADTGRHELAVWDVGQGRWAGRIAVGQAPYAVAYSAMAERLVVANAGDGTLTLLSPFDSGYQSVVSLGGLGFPLELAVDERGGRCYVAYALSAKYGAIAAVDLATGRVQDIRQGDAGWPLIGVRGLAWDAEAQGLYVLDVGGVRRLDIEEGGEPARVERAAPVRGILADPAANRAYAVEVQWRLSGLD
ncbi:MAG: DUF11 domain-containing protein [Chloroflexi bacterium]|nr:DUF11 domain-containing protein [Chloroflexota bacterium]